MIFVAFRFHGNFYHSYRGDTPDELGFGKDIRIIRHIIKTLDDLNARGIPVCGTWDFENYFSLQEIMPVHCPDIIVGVQRRSKSGADEIQLMSYNNGLVSAHTAREFEASISRAISNPQGSGLRDLFGDAFAPMVRPQEMMFTPIHLELYKALGITSISLFYSALPFNGFSNFIPQLLPIERYNPLTLTYPGIAETMTLMPCYNTGDLADHLTLRRWVKQMRRQQEAMDIPQDMLLLIDMDADDDFWVGFDVPVLKDYFSTAGGLKGLVENIADLEYIRFTTPCRYLEAHLPVKTITIAQDTADGSFDGMSSWAEKWSNHRLWTGLERARIMDLQVRRLVGNEILPEVQWLLSDAFESRLKLLSTTHFGMAAPVMNLTRESIARDLARHAVEMSSKAFDVSAGETQPGALSLIDFVRGESTGNILFHPRSSSALIRLPLQNDAPEKFCLLGPAGEPIPCSVLQTEGRRELFFVEKFSPMERKDYEIVPGEQAPAPKTPVVQTDKELRNEYISLSFDDNGQINGLQYKGREFSQDILLSSEITYAGQSLKVEKWQRTENLSLGVIGATRMVGSVQLKGGQVARFDREILIAAGLPYLYVTMRVQYPLTPNQGYSKGKAQRLQQAWDNRWQEVKPCEITPALAGETESPLRVWKHNYCGHVSTFRLDYGRYSKNVELDSINNQVTHAWTAVTDGQSGLLVAHTADVTSGMAFCPLRTRRQGKLHVRLNPFGSYWGRQYRYASADTGLGNLLATNFSASDHINPYAPSYNGRTQEFSLLIAPYLGDAPPEKLQSDAEAFAYPYISVGDEQIFATAYHHMWDTGGLGANQ